MTREECRRAAEIAVREAATVEPGWDRDFIAYSQVQATMAMAYATMALDRTRQP